PVLAVMFLSISDGTVADLGEGFRIEVDEHRQVNYLRPGGTKLIPLKVENQGDLEDSYIATLTVSNPSWDVNLDRYSFLNMSPREIRYVNMTITAPYGPTGNFTDINLTLWSQRSNKNESLHWREFINWKREMRLSYEGPLLKNLTSDLRANWALEVQNTGDYPIDVQLTYSLNQHEDKLVRGFSVQMTSWKVHLETNEGTEVVVTVEITDETLFTTEIDYTMFIVGKDLNDPDEVYGSVRIVWYVPWMLNVTATPRSVSFDVVPMEWRGVIISLTQNSTDRWGHTWEISFTGKVDDFEVFVNPEERSFTLVGSDDTYFQFHVRAMEYTKPGTTLHLTAHLRCPRTPDISLDIEVHVIVSESRKISVKEGLAPSYFSPPGTAEIRVRWTNHGNVPEQIGFKMASSFPMGERYQPFGTAEFNETLYPGETRRWTRSVTFEDGMAAGTYYFNMNTYIVNNDTYIGNFLSVTVPPSRKLVITGLPLNDVELNPNLDSVEMPFRLENRGNTKLVLIATVVEGTTSDVANGFLMNLPDPPLIELQMGEGRNLTFVMVVPRSTTFGSGSMELIFNDTLSTRRWSNVVHYRIKGPELEIVEVEGPRRSKTDERVELDVKIVNRGTGTSPQTLLVVQDRFGGKPMGETLVSALPAGVATIVTVEFTPHFGKGSYYVVLDPDDSVFETGNENNWLAHEITVSDPPLRGPSNIALTVAAYALVGLVLVALRRRQLSKL
ncbi:MAG: hypothetical protein KAQ96_00305, partial [Thermoplasmata archaeon]|nr:hypothetical protein [Thermoplasmata archaeon]